MDVLQTEVAVARIARLPLMPHRGGQVNPTYIRSVGGKVVAPRSLGIDSMTRQGKTAFFRNVTVDFGQALERWREVKGRARK